MPYVVVSKNQVVRKRRKFLRSIGLVLFLLFIAAIVLAINIYWRSTIPTLIEITQAKVSAQTVLVVNEAVSTAMVQCTDTSQLLSIERDADGNVVLLTSNTTEVNKLARYTAILSQQRLDQLAKEEIEIPFGTISGIPLFSEMGPDITITVTPIGAVNCTFTSTFESVGINQTLHRMYINVSCKIDLIIPTAHHTIYPNIPILVSESVIVGKVPTTYLQGGLLMGSYGNAA